MNDKLSEKYFDIYDHYCHSQQPRREFLKKLAKVAGGTVAAALLPWLEGTGAEAAMVAPGDGRLTTATESFAGTGQGIKAYVVRPKGSGKLPAVVVMHGRTGLTPHIRDIARRVALEGFLAVAPDLMAPFGGTPKDREKARDKFWDMPSADVLKNMVGTGMFAKNHKHSTGKVGAIGFCAGGKSVNLLAVNYAGLSAAVAYYGRQPKKGAENIKAAMLLHYAENDRGVNRGIDRYVKALKDAGKTFTIHKYPGTRHSFSNEENGSRYNEAAAKLAWRRTVAHFKKYLGG